jgi:glucokinase
VSGGESPAGILVLAGDVGGTKTNLGLFRLAPRLTSGTAPGLPPRPVLVRGAHFASADFPGLAPLLAAFLGADRGADRPPLAAACFGVPGPVVGNHTRTPNLAWEIDGAALGRELGIPALDLVNDLVATAAGVELLGPADLAVLQAGDPRAAADAGANRALIAAGTGLGMALMPALPATSGGGRFAVASEGGHMDYAPRTEEEIALQRTLRRRFGHASVERVVSGPGLHNVYLHLLEAAGEGAELPEVAARLAAEDPGQVIAEAALAGASPLCARALDLFAAAYGAAAGNLALAGTATGGVYLGGGIAPKILGKLGDGTFLAAFRDKGRFRPYLEAVPVSVVTNDRAALLGAARLAAERLAA